MGERAAACRRRAIDCEQAASRVKDPDVPTAYLTCGPVASNGWAARCYGSRPSGSSKAREVDATKRGTHRRRIERCKKYVGFCVKVPREGPRPMRVRGTEN